MGFLFFRKGNMESEAHKIAVENWHLVPDDLKCMSREELAMMLTGIHARMHLIAHEWTDRKFYGRAREDEINKSECPTLARILNFLEDYRQCAMLDDIQHVLGRVKDIIGKSGYVYVAEFSDGHVKIGKSINPEVRLRNIAGSNQASITRQWISPALVDPYAVENAAHRHFAADRVGGEFFKASFDAIVAWVSQYKDVVERVGTHPYTCNRLKLVKGSA